MKQIKKQIFEHLRMLSVMLGQDVTRERINAYVEMLPLSNPSFDSKGFLSRMSTMARVFKRFPSYPEFEAHVLQGIEVRDEAQIIAGEIIDSIGRFGKYQIEDAKKHLGDKTWFVVERFGGWVLLCKTELSQLVNVRAHLRDQARAMIALDNLTAPTSRPLLNQARNELKKVSFELPKQLEK